MDMNLWKIDKINVKLWQHTFAKDFLFGVEKFVLIKKYDKKSFKKKNIWCHLVMIKNNLFI